MDPVSWVDQFPSGIISIGTDGTVNVPPRTHNQTVNNSAISRSLAVLQTGNTHNLPPASYEMGSLPVMPTTSNVIEGFSSRGGSIINNLIVIVLLLFISVIVMRFN